MTTVSADPVCVPFGKKSHSGGEKSGPKDFFVEEEGSLLGIYFIFIFLQTELNFFDRFGLFLDILLCH